MSGALASIGSNLLGPAAAAGLNALINPGNGFRTQPAGPLPPALYSLAIRGAGAPYIPYFIYYFPISPSNVRKEVVGMGNYYDVAGSPFQFGVERVLISMGKARLSSPSPARPGSNTMPPMADF